MATTTNLPMVGTEASSVNSYFNGLLYDLSTYSAGVSFPTSKYVDMYSYSTSNVSHGRSKLGDAMKETLATYGSTSGGWYSDAERFASSANPWFLRGGSNTTTTTAGIFAVHYSGGIPTATAASRSVITKP